jgi:hypothetical protein
MGTFRDAFLRSRSLASGEGDGGDLALTDSAEQIRKHLRARRWQGEEVGWLTGVRLPGGFKVRLLNISSSGLLIQSGIRFVPGDATRFELWGPKRDVIVSARIVRTEEAHPGSRAKIYQTAATFDHELTLLTPRTTSPAVAASLIELMGRLKEYAERHPAPGELRHAFEVGIRDLVPPARAVQLHAAPIPDGGHDSVYFTIPTGQRTEPVLQVTFEREQRLEKEELELLEAAAVLAADVLAVDPI